MTHAVEEGIGEVYFRRRRELVWSDLGPGQRINLGNDRWGSVFGIQNDGLRNTFGSKMVCLNWLKHF
ncbi:hypothetical protein L596_011383 [Steinernema carpocapsae]|uniref:Uncharacterized protein n=1 Tax=Steinernema carpocapsae TaxID=34508 RepID=A0A4U5NTQ0_STECR|nr:hypothetical protein L596_011383 [Steinernema carpocapsae]